MCTYSCLICKPILLLTPPFSEFNKKFKQLQKMCTQVTNLVERNCQTNLYQITNSDAFLLIFTPPRPQVASATAVQNAFKLKISGDSRVKLL